MNYVFSHPANRKKNKQTNVVENILSLGKIAWKYQQGLDLNLHKYVCDNSFLWVRDLKRNFSFLNILFCAATASLGVTEPSLAD